MMMMDVLKLAATIAACAAWAWALIVIAS